MNKKLRIAILADLTHEIHKDAIEGEAVFAYEFICALSESAERVGGISLNLFARRHSSCGIPTISIDPTELGVPESQQTSFAIQETIYTKLLLSGILQQYDLVHCLAPIVNPIQLLGQQGIPVVYSPLISPEHPSMLILKNIDLDNRLYVQLPIRPCYPEQRVTSINPCVDLNLFRPQGINSGFALWLGTRTQEQAILAERIAQSLHLPLKDLSNGNPKLLLQEANVLIHLPKSASVGNCLWPMRAIACGIPVVGWSDPVLETFFTRSELGYFFSQAQTSNLNDLRNKNFLLNSDSIRVRREFSLAHFNQRALSARCREIYKEMLNLGS